MPIHQVAYQVPFMVLFEAGALLESYCFIFRKSYHFSRHLHCRLPLALCLSFVDFVIFGANPCYSLVVSAEIWRENQIIMPLKSSEMSVLLYFLFLNLASSHLGSLSFK